MSQRAFYRGSASTGDIAQQLKNYIDQVGREPEFLARTVLVDIGSEKWEHYSTTVHLWPTDGLLRLSEAECDRVKLKERKFDLIQLGSTESPFGNLIAWWNTQNQNVNHVLNENNRFFVEHYDSLNEWREEPCWVIRLSSNPTSSGSSIPFYDESFLSADKQFFAVDFWELARRWSNNPRPTPQLEVGAYYLVIPDKRLWLGSCELHGEELDMTVHASKLDNCSCVVRYRDIRNTQVTQIHKINSGKIAIPAVRFMKSIDVWLLRGTEVTDHYHEDEYSLGSRRSVLYPDRALSDPSFAELGVALKTGETDQIEFKEWIAAKPTNDKSKELLETAVAFSNLKGGNIFIGVTNNAEPIGVTKPLLINYAKKFAGDRARMLDAYISDLKAMLMEGIERAIMPTFEVIEFGGSPIVRIFIPQGPDQPYSIVKSGEIYVRAGATNRKRRPSDTYLFSKGIPGEEYSFWYPINRDPTARP